MSGEDAKGAGGGELERILAEPVHTGTAYKPFAEWTVEEVEARAAELAGAGGVAAMQPVASVAAVWKGLAEAMRRQPAASVADLDREQLRSRAGRLRVLPPGGSFL